MIASCVAVLVVLPRGTGEVSLGVVERGCARLPRVAQGVAHVIVQGEARAVQGVARGDIVEDFVTSIASRGQDDVVGPKD